MVAILYILALHILKRSAFFETITIGYLCPLSLSSASALDMWAHLVGFKKKVVEENKIMKLSFF